MPAANLVIFGANGDLALKKLIPSLYNLYLGGFLKNKFNILGISRTSYTSAEFAARFADYLQTSKKDFSIERWREFASHLHYIALDVNLRSSYLTLRDKLAELSSGDLTYNNFFYLATAPDLFEQILIRLAENGLISDNNQGYRTDVIIEKPIGYDLASARRLNQTFCQYLKEEQIYRIDHYLGKETVQNLLLFRFTNAIFESIWNHNYIEQIEITVAESADVANRAAYYDHSGCLRDMIQNHLFQLLSLVCIEPPAAIGEARSIRDEKVKVLRSIKRFDPEAIKNNIIRGQYVQGSVAGREVVAYREHRGVAEESTTETFVAMKIEIDNWRWTGVPILLRTGKCLSKRISEIKVFFKKTPQALFKNIKDLKISPNVLSFQLYPEEGISMQFNSKPPGLDMQVRSVEMDFEYDQSFNEAIFDAYERLLLDVFRGDQTLFIRDDEVEESWSLLDPILSAWSKDSQIPLCAYPAGSNGPVEINQLTKDTPNHWSIVEGD